MVRSLDELEPVTEATVRELCTSGVEVSPVVVASPEGGFALVFSYGATGREVQRVLETSRGPVRRFGSIDTAASFLRDLAVQCFSVDLADYQPGRVRGPRPDRAEALRKTRTSPRQASLLL